MKKTFIDQIYIYIKQKNTSKLMLQKHLKRYIEGLLEVNPNAKCIFRNGESLNLCLSFWTGTVLLFLLFLGWNTIETDVKTWDFILRLLILCLGSTLLFFWIIVSSRMLLPTLFSYLFIWAHAQRLAEGPFVFLLQSTVLLREASGHEGSVLCIQGPHCNQNTAWMGGFAFQMLNYIQK